MGVRLLLFILIFLCAVQILRVAWKAWKNSDIDYKIDQLEEQEEAFEVISAFKKAHPNTKASKEEIEKFLKQ